MQVLANAAAIFMTGAALIWILAESSKKHN